MVANVLYFIGLYIALPLVGGFIALFLLWSSYREGLECFKVEEGLEKGFVNPWLIASSMMAITPFLYGCIGLVLAFTVEWDLGSEIIQKVILTGGFLIGISGLFTAMGRGIIGHELGRIALQIGSTMEFSSDKENLQRYKCILCYTVRFGCGYDSGFCGTVLYVR